MHQKLEIEWAPIGSHTFKQKKKVGRAYFTPMSFIELIMTSMKLSKFFQKEIL